LNPVNILYIDLGTLRICEILLKKIIKPLMVNINRIQ